MIAPSKHLPVERSLLGVGGILLSRLNRATTVSRLWEGVRDEEEIASYEVFTLTLSMLFAVGAVTLDENMLQRTLR